MSEIIMFVGLPASGKSTTAKKYEKKGYVRLNKDSIGGKIANLVPLMVDEIKKGNNVILDNTHCTIEHRKHFIAAAKANNAVVKCIWFNTSIVDCEINACIRMIQRYEKIFEPKDLKKHKDPNIFPPGVLKSFEKIFIKPTLEEGFNEIVEEKFEREWPSDFVNQSLIIDYDGTVRDVPENSTNGMYPVNKSEVKILPNRREKLKKYKEKGYILCGISNQSGVHKQIISYKIADDLFKCTNKLLDQDIDYRFCPHQSFPILCWCRKPNVANAVDLILKHKLNPAKCIFVGDYHTDKRLAEKIGFQYYDAKDFFNE